MFLSFNQKSIALGASVALIIGNLGVAKAQSNTQEVAIDFEAWVGRDKFECDRSYDRVGESETTITPTDFRFYVSDVALIDADGNAVPVELEQDGRWQYQNVALLDFENGTGACDNGTAETNSTIVGTVPEGEYESLQFTLGVPKDLNHEDAAIAPSPLNLTSMWWNWQGGYKFLRVELETDNEIATVASTSSTVENQNGGNIQSDRQSTTTIGENQTTVQTSDRASIFKNGEGSHSQTSSTHTSSSDGNHQASSNSYLIHLGSTGCKDSAQSDLFGCANPNRSEIVLEDFNPEEDVVIADLAELLYESDLTTNQADTAQGCMSSPEDADCNPIMQRLGLRASETNDGQQFFFVE